jgi:hypothetical protein
MSFSLSCKLLIWHVGTASIVASLLKCVTSLLTRSRDPSPLLRHSSVYSCCLATNEARQCANCLGSAPFGMEKTLLRLLLCNRGSVFRCYHSFMVQIRHTAPSLRLFVPNSLMVCHLSFLPYAVLAMSVIGVIFLPVVQFLLWWSLSNRYIHPLLKNNSSQTVSW